ncbi:MULTISPECIES: twin-arginine translocase TatA/TatE family subunit [Anaeromyxobacter]|uniref:twin-arginine translocase TatA/TatE family subunit n=1 Tax=Anaeromyxobacter TaxID=161492 RepID=UPI001F5A1FD8|nr:MULTISPECIES: twin-arginine translocase TatA/TatE family subunit [unclassified Anaeromyxobacter]
MTELLLVLFVTLLVFGATRIPALGDALGRAVRNARAGASGEPPARGREGDSRHPR